MEIQLVEIYKPGCAKCDYAFNIMSKILDKNVTIQKVTGENVLPWRSLQLNVNKVPTILVFVDDKYVGKIESGFTPRKLRQQVEEITGYAITVNRVLME